MSQRETVLEEYVVPICRVAQVGSSAKIKAMLGTAFFINGSGVFLTAGHVADTVSHAVAGQWVGLNVKDEAGRNVVSRIAHIERARPPHDVAIGTIDRKSQSWFNVRRRDVTLWAEVATLGYPDAALNVTPAAFNIATRGLKGTVTRVIAANEVPQLIPHPPCLELSFAVPKGMSGAPLFRPIAGQVLVGVCVGSIAAEVSEYGHTEVREDGKEFSEKRLRVEEYGLAHSLEPLFDWRPSILSRELGASIEEAT
jgi:hypothetical protein